MAKSSEPFFWFLFVGGATIAAIFVPVQIVVTGIAGPAGWLGSGLAYERFLALVSHPVSKLYLFVLISLPLLHWAHRFRFTVIDLGLRANKRGVAFLCYASALIGSILAAVVLLRL
ncbi:MAG: fumarate reductase subunit FrdD [Anaerolineales bacterium]